MNYIHGWAVWVNGNSDMISDPYSKFLGYFQTENELRETFKKWREENPSSGGWRYNAWCEYAFSHNSKRNFLPIGE
jgi:hypothetical protein